MTERTLALLLTGPLQSWGCRSSFNYRDTQDHPTLSGILGLLASASGITRDEPLPEEWSGLSMLIRVDRAGTPLTDYHLIGGGYPAAERMITAEKSRRSHAVITERDYLSDAAFTVYLQGSAEVTEELARALKAPHWSPYLGRRACPPSLPVLLGTVGEKKEEIAARLPLYRAGRKKAAGGKPAVLRVDAYRDARSSAREEDDIPVDRWARDVPTGSDPENRSFSERPVNEFPLEFTTDDCAGIGIAAYTTIVTALKEAA
ncbi:type I-E CRISPR-associated protein Cas5/CasD [Nocardiopsis ansamitocini]|uniref:Type I-E CRISPR-associated protein Cas5/CasD n=1 Tax=Nocardiopsis ansamitocini TaxID=1670832 RepID=A0A9W6UJL8_9ACTN|nr:type I-E CRISPR-associated protein Cas5/CasD [Nocardiopsis ansamitocini]GLU48648.1 hypothetical protein Nans01_29990 [Nocardiopsis ansamitocini]